MKGPAALWQSQERSFTYSFPMTVRPSNTPVKASNSLPQKSDESQRVKLSNGKTMRPISPYSAALGSFIDALNRQRESDRQKKIAGRRLNRQNSLTRF